jgi:SAM-dependent methyltransferase
MSDESSTQSRVGIRKSYDTIAAEYANRIYDELKDKPFDRELLDKFARQVGDSGLICDLGCGPGQIARYLRDCGARSFGLDLSGGMLAEARRLNRGISFVQGSMLALGLRSGSLAAIAAFYSIIHIPREQVVSALSEMKRVLRPGGLLLLAFHLGTEVLHEDQLWGYPVDFDAVLFTSKEMSGYLRTSGFEILQSLERDPYAEDIEYQSRRGYILSANPRHK